ncbi:LysE family translocator [Streptomyces fagopyri]|uniref:LysE family translocator n=1 Tax=Streptomyces fagopyri TaxID=2662397 RepID=A0A5Q0LKV9_9ACTN|nr:LysE family translocator [Streptomyces fagopyri]QFZ77688.1 LysE family translocator [Streptomyces fagopyri]
MDAQLIAFTAVAAGMVAMPGADFTVVVRNALVSRRAGVACALGVAGGLLLHTALAVAGVAAVLAAVPALFRTLQFLGGVYVLYLGVRTLDGLRRRRARDPERRRDRERARERSAVPGGTPYGGVVSGGAVSGRTVPGGAASGGIVSGGAVSGVPGDRSSPLRQGFVTNALNPKAPITFLSLLPQFVPAGSPAMPRTLVLALIVVALALVWFPAVALLVDRLGRWLRGPRAARAVEGVTGSALTVLGLVLLLEPLTA